MMPNPAAVTTSDGGAEARAQVVRTLVYDPCGGKRPLRSHQSRYCLTASRFCSSVIRGSSYQFDRLSFDASLFVDIPTSENPDRLLKLVTALRALKSDQKRVRPGHF